jgi:hypothetical protein
MASKTCELCRVGEASTHIEVVDQGKRRKRAVCSLHCTRLSAPLTAESIAAAADRRRLDQELADSFPASDPPSILRGGI